MGRLNILKLREVAPAAPAPAPEPVPDIPVPAPAVVLESLCRTCAVSHIAQGHADGQETLLCGLNGWLRELPFPVARCTDYRVRGKRAASPAGFGRE
jgi:hypothetical protein